MKFNTPEHILPSGDKNPIDEIRPRLSGNKRVAFENLIKKENSTYIINKTYKFVNGGGFTTGDLDGSDVTIQTNASNFTNLYLTHFKKKV